MKTLALLVALSFPTAANAQDWASRIARSQGFVPIEQQIARNYGYRYRAPARYYRAPIRYYRAPVYRAPASRYPTYWE